MITSASVAACSTEVTLKPASSALVRDADPSRSPTRTSTPDSERLRAWAWPWDPYPKMATLRPWRREGSASDS